jgi:solute carrier family 25 S-adenosylmethionine transporter 26
VRTLRARVRTRHVVQVPTLKKVYAEEGWRNLFLGVKPRVMWIGIGGFVYFGAYEGVKDYLSQ